MVSVRLSLFVIVRTLTCLPKIALYMADTDREGLMSFMIIIRQANIYKAYANGYIAHFHVAQFTLNMPY